MLPRTYHGVAASRPKAAQCCGKSLTIHLDTASDRRFKVCRIPSGVFATVQPGEAVTFTGRATDYGMIWEQVDHATAF